MKSLINSEYHDEIKIDDLKGNFNRMSIEINKKEKLQQLEQVDNLSTYPSQRFNSFCYDDDDDDDDKDYTVAITPDFLITNSLIMENEHFDTILETESDELIKSSVENLVPIPSESEDFFDIKSKCDMPDCDDSQTINFSTFSNPLFDDSTSSDDDEFNLIHNDDLDSTPKNDRFDTKSYLLESLLNRDTLMASSPKFDSLLEEFSGELAHTNLIPPGINEANCDPEKDIHLVERLLYNNLSPRPPKYFNFENSDFIIESFSPSPILIEDSDPFMEIDLFLVSDGSIPPGISAVDYLSKWVEAKALLTNDAQVVCKFLKNLFARFGTPRAINNDHETYFYNDQFANVMLKYGVTYRLAAAYHPQTSGQVGVSNGLKLTLKGQWARTMPHGWTS
nr:reverse transcriptase domain-containing protein [Tanacetum cinerariifolium]